MQHVDGDGAVGHGGGAKRRAVHCAHNGEHKQRARHNVSGKEGEKQKIAHQQHLLARKTIDQKTAERPEKQRRERVTRQHQPDGVLVGAESVAQVEWQQRRQQHKRKENHKVGAPNLYVVAVPEFRFCSVCILLSH